MKDNKINMLIDLAKKMNTKKSEILIDMDNTICDLTSHVLFEYEKLTGEKVEHQQIVNYNFSLCVSSGHVIEDIICSRGFFNKLEPYPNAVKFLNRLIEEDEHDITILTQPSRRVDTVFAEKTDWLKKHFPSLDMSNVIFAHKKHRIHGDLLFDDNPGHLVRWKDRHPEGKTCKIIHPYNKDVTTDYSLSLDKAWKDFYYLVKSMA